MEDSLLWILVIGGIYVLCKILDHWYKIRMRELDLDELEITHPVKDSNES